MGERGDEWEFERIGTEREKMQVEKELHDLRERLAQVDDWKKRRDEIEAELAAVWTDKGEELEAPESMGESAEVVEVTEGEEADTRVEVDTGVMGQQ